MNNKKAFLTIKLITFCTIIFATALMTRMLTLDSELSVLNTIEHLSERGLNGSPDEMRTSLDYSRAFVLTRKNDLKESWMSGISYQFLEWLYENEYLKAMPN